MLRKESQAAQYRPKVSANNSHLHCFHFTFLLFFLYPSPALNKNHAPIHLKHLGGLQGKLGVVITSPQKIYILLDILYWHWGWVSQRDRWGWSIPKYLKVRLPCWRVEATRANPTVRTGVRGAKTEIKTQEDGLGERGMKTSLQIACFQNCCPSGTVDMGSG